MAREPVAREPYFLLKTGIWIVLNGVLWAVLYDTMRPWMPSHAFTAALLAGGFSGVVGLPPVLKAAFPRSGAERFPPGGSYTPDEAPSPAIDARFDMADQVGGAHLDGAAAYFSAAENRPNGSWAADLPLLAFFGMVPAGLFYSSLRHIEPRLLMSAPLEVLIATTLAFSLAITGLGCLCYLLPGGSPPDGERRSAP